jgi:hypothetical protein
LASGEAESAREGIAAALKVPFQLKGSAELCKICIPDRRIFPESSEMTHCTRNKIAQQSSAAL